MLKSGKPGKTKVSYSDVDDAVAWLWKFVDGAKSAGELYGRTMVVFAAQHYAKQLVLATSKRRHSVLPSSHDDRARKAFERVCRSSLPDTHKQLERAIAREAHARVAGGLYADALGPKGSRGETYRGALIANTRTIASALAGGRLQCRF
jgi:hypothetical protein